jgi:predicted nuclease with TOPRIM domain
MNKEFNHLITELKEKLARKVKFLESKVDFNAYTQGKINNVNGRIKALEESASDIIQNYPNIPEMKINFRKRANDIHKEIENL